MTPGSMDFRGPMGFRKASASEAHVLQRGLIEMTLRNQHVEPEELFFVLEIN